MLSPRQMVLVNLGQMEDFGIDNYNMPVPYLGRPTERIEGTPIGLKNSKLNKRDFMLNIESLSKNKVNAGLYNPHKD